MMTTDAGAVGGCFSLSLITDDYDSIIMMIANSTYSSPSSSPYSPLKRLLQPLWPIFKQQLAPLTMCPL